MTGPSRSSWFIDDLSDFKFVALDAAIDRVLSVRGIDLVRTEWLKALGWGVHGFRVRHDAEEIARMFGAEAPEVAGQPEKLRRLLALDDIPGPREGAGSLAAPEDE